MPNVQIDIKGCRGCLLCVKKCPVEFFESYTDPKNNNQLVKTVDTDTCMGCFACYYQCPSQCIQISDVDRQRPFYRIDENIRFTENFLQVEATSEDLTKEEWEYARKDVSMTLTALAKAIQQVFGNGTEAIAFHAGALAAPHFPEVYEVKEPEEKLQRLRQRLRHCFDFDFQKDGDNLEFTFTSCGIHHVVQDAGNEKVGDALLCHLFHDFWTSLVGSYCDVEYNYKTEEIGTQCKLVLSPLA